MMNIHAARSHWKSLREYRFNHIRRAEHMARLAYATLIEGDEIDRDKARELARHIPSAAGKDHSTEPV